MEKSKKNFKQSLKKTAWFLFKATLKSILDDVEDVDGVGIICSDVDETEVDATIRYALFEVATTSYGVVSARLLFKNKLYFFLQSATLCGPKKLRSKGCILHDETMTVHKFDFVLQNS